MSEPDPLPYDNELRMQTFCLLTLTLIATGITLWLLRPVLVPFVLALFFVIGLSPLLDYIQRRLNATRPAAVGVSFLLGLGMILAFGSILTTSIGTIIDHSEDYEESVGDAVVATAAWLDSIGIDYFTRDEADDASAGGAKRPSTNETALEEGEASARTETDESEGDNRRQVIIGRAVLLAKSQTRAALTWLGGTLLSLLASLGIVSIFVFFLLAGASSGARPTSGLWEEIESKIRGYIITKSVISFFTGLAFGAVLCLFGMDLSLAVVLGLLAFLLNFVPNVGPVIASVLPIPIVMFIMPDLTTTMKDGDLFTSGYSVWWKVCAIAAGSAVQIISGNVIEPKVMGDSFELHPIVILLSLVLWGMMWGPVGVLLAVPMTAAVKVLLAKIERTQPVAELLAGRLEPIEEAIDRGGLA